MTNRQWLHSLNDTQLAQFMMGQLFVRYKAANAPAAGFNIGINLSWATTDAVEEWLRSPQEYEIVGYF